MAKNSVDDWSLTADENTDVGGINIAEGCAPSGINNAIRTVMAQLRAVIGGAIGDYLDTVRNPGTKYLRRDGAIYNALDYPALAALLPALASGILWSSVTPPYGSATPSGFAIDPTSGRMGIVAGTTFYYSDDGGVTWASVALPVTPALTNRGDSSVAYGNGRWVIVGQGSTAGQITVSTNGGVTWSAPTAALQNTPYGIVFGGGVFVAAHRDSGTSGTNRISSSPDGLAWTNRLGPQTQVYYMVSGTGAGLVISDQNAKYYTSSDGATWTTLTPSLAYPAIYKAIRGTPNITFGGAGVIHTTNDFVTETDRASGTTADLNAGIFSTPWSVIVGAGGVARISQDGGTTWTASTTGISTDLTYLLAPTTGTISMIALGPGAMLRGVKTSTSQFRTPNDNPTTGWIKAL